MKIISINAGSSSLKFSLFNMDDEAVIASGLFERIGIEGSNYTIKFNGEKITQEVELATHVDAVNILLDKLTDLNIISSLDEINGVGHRIVQGKDIFTESVVVNDDVIKRVKSDEINTKIPGNIIAKFYLGGVINLGVEWLKDDNKYTKEDIIKYLDILIPDDFRNF